MKQQQKTFTFWIVLILMLALVFKMVQESKQLSKKITFSEFAQYVKDGKVEKATIIMGKEEVRGRYADGFKANGEGQREFFLEADPKVAADFLEKNGLVPNFEKGQESLLPMFLFNWAPIILLLVIFFYFLRQIQAGGGKAMSFGKSRARMLTPNEARKLQGFPEGFKIPVSNLQAYKQFGNSVSVPVIRAIAERIVKLL